MHPGSLLLSSTAAVAAITLGASPATFTPNQAGTAYIAGGTVSKIELNRTGTATTLGIISGSVELRKGDTMTVTYAVIPTTAVFVPA